MRTKGSKNGRTVAQMRNIYKAGDTVSRFVDRRDCGRLQDRLKEALDFLRAYLTITDDRQGLWEFRDPVVCRMLFGIGKHRLIDRDVQNNQDALEVLDHCIRSLKRARARMEKW